MARPIWAPQWIGSSIDKFTTTAMVEELSRRLALEDQGKCSWCGRTVRAGVILPSCAAPEFHKVRGLTGAQFLRIRSDLDYLASCLEETDSGVQRRIS